MGGNLDFERRKRLAELEAKLNYSFRDPALLDTAMTHTSYVKGDCRALSHNERLEFLGDAVLELCVSEHLYRRFPDFDEGAMTRLRAQTVCEGALCEVARGLDKPSILSDALEAVIGALYIDGGMEIARAFILNFVDAGVDEMLKGGALKDYKTMLQEYIQKRHMGAIAYRLTGSSGPDHSKVFTMEVSIAGIPVSMGEGRTKQEAGQKAARAALATFGLLD